MKTFMDYAREVMDFFRGEKGIPLDPEPSVRVDMSEHGRFDPFPPTGHYDYVRNEITLYASNRQCKDVLRTLCHELVHAAQYQRDPEAYARMDKGGTLAENPELRECEREAYEKGSLWFRDWTEAAR